MKFTLTFKDSGAVSDSLGCEMDDQRPTAAELAESDGDAAGWCTAKQEEIEGWLDK